MCLINIQKLVLMLKIILVFLCYLTVLETKECIILVKKFSHIVYLKYCIHYTLEDLDYFNLTGNSQKKRLVGIFGNSVLNYKLIYMRTSIFPEQSAKIHIKAFLSGIQVQESTS